jgi:hypothetical protein
MAAGHGDGGERGTRQDAARGAWRAERLEQLITYKASGLSVPLGIFSIVGAFLRVEETALRRALPQHQAAKGKELLGLARDHLARKVTEKLAGGRFELIAPDGDGLFVVRHRPLRLIDAIWQRFAEEIAGIMTAARCPAPGCGRWFPRNGGRSDRQFCSHACQMRAWRKEGQHAVLR